MHSTKWMNLKDYAEWKQPDTKSTVMMPFIWNSRKCRLKQVTERSMVLWVLVWVGGEGDFDGGYSCEYIYQNSPNGIC